ncbi:MAG: hypothetical protein Q8P67_04115 [archaeon]|nr:hypothetical protein [archaeon]
MMRSPVPRMLLALLLASLIALNAFAVEVPLVRRTHVRTLLREIYRAKFDFPDDQKLPISEWRQNNDSATTGASSRLSRAVTLPLRGGSLRLGEIFMNVQVGSPPTIYSVQGPS